MPITPSFQFPGLPAGAGASPLAMTMAPLLIQGQQAYEKERPQALANLMQLWEMYGKGLEKEKDLEQQMEMAREEEAGKMARAAQEKQFNWIAEAQKVDDRLQRYILNKDIRITPVDYIIMESQFKRTLGDEAGTKKALDWFETQQSRLGGRVLTRPETEMYRALMHKVDEYLSRGGATPQYYTREGFEPALTQESALKGQTEEERYESLKAFYPDLEDWVTEQQNKKFTAKEVFEVIRKNYSK